MITVRPGSRPPQDESAPMAEMPSHARPVSVPSEHAPKASVTIGAKAAMTAFTILVLGTALALVL
jgi:hypothetical protein